MSEFLAAYLGAAGVFSLVEWMVHRHLMHRRPLPAWCYRLAYFRATYENHAVLHHRRYYAIYDHEPDPAGRELNLRFTLSDLLLTNLGFAPLYALAAAWSWSAALGIAAMLLSYMFLWNALHTEMHIPSNRWPFRNGAFRTLNRRHFLHHRHPSQNLNVVFPIWDRLLGTEAAATAAEREDMRAYGLFGDRRGPSARHASPGQDT